jgi:hypothetical protein
MALASTLSDKRHKVYKTIQIFSLRPWKNWFSLVCDQLEKGSLLFS